MTFPRIRHLLYGLLVLGVTLAAAIFLLLQSDIFWEQWAGPRLVKLINAEIQGTLTVGQIKGTPFSGYVFRDLRLTTPQGKIFQARELEISLSFYSLLALRPSIRLALVQPDLALQQDAQGGWNAAQLLRPSPKPSGPIKLPIAAIHLAPVLIKDGKVTLSQPGGTRRFSQLNLDLEATLSQPFSPRPRIEVKKISLGATTPWAPLKLAGQNLTIGAGLLEVGSLVMESKGRRLLTLSGNVPLAGGTNHLQVTGDLGPIPGKILHFFWAGWPAAWETSGKLRVTGPSSNVKVDFQGRVHQAAFSLKGALSQVREIWNYDLTLQTTKVPAQMLAVLVPSRAKEIEPATPLSAQLQLKGSGLGWPPRQFAWDLRLEPLRYRQVQLEQAQLSLAGTDKQQKLAGSFRGNFGRVAVAAQGSFFKAPQGTLTAQVEDFKPGLFGLGLPPGSLLTGKFSGEAALPDPAKPQQLSVSGEVRAAGRIGEHPLREFRARFAWAQPRLTIKECRAQVGNLLVEAQGSMAGNDLNFRTRGRSLAGGSWPVPANLGGSLSWEGAVTGRWPEPAYNLRLNGQALSWGKFSLKSLTLRAQGQGLPPRAGTLNLKGRGVKTPAGTFAQVNFAGQGGHGQWQFNLKAASPPKGPQAMLAGTANFGTRPLALTLTQLSYQGQGLDLKNQGPVQLQFWPGLALAPATFRLNRGTVTAQANLQNNQISALLTVQNLPLALARVKGLRGKIQARLSLSGAANTPQLEGQISIAAGKFRGYAFQAIQTTLNYSNAGLTFTGDLQDSQQKGRLSWKGRLPVRFSLSPFRFALLDEDLQLKLTGQSNLAVVAALTAEVEQANAPLNLQLDVSGRLAQPRITGELRWGAGHITLSQAGTPYQLLPGSLRWENDRITLPQLTLKSEGTAVLHADISLSGFKPQRATARAQFNNFKALDKLGSDAYVNGAVNLTGPWSALVLAGQLTIPRATINPALLKKGGTSLPADYVLVGTKSAAKKPEEIPVPSPYQSMKIAVSLEAPNNLKVINKMANIEVALDLRIKKRPGAALQVGGIIRSLKGKIDVYGKEFILERGLVTLPGIPDQEPYLQAQAIHKMTDATFMVNVSGPVNNPKIDLASNPAMPPNELLSYLIFGRPSSTLNKQEFDVAQQAVGVLGGITANKIQEFLGKDFPILGNVSVKGGQGTIGVTKPLTKGVTLSVERKLNPAEGDNPVQLRLQYRINRHFSLEAEGGQNNTGADALFNYEW